MAGRPRSFDRDVALDTAMRQFWRRGYEQTTVASLTEEMGITPPSLYAAFGDKDQLFHEAAGWYTSRLEAALADALDQPTARQAIAELLAVTVAAQTRPGEPPGCLVLSEKRLGDGREAIRRQIEARLLRGQVDGDLSVDIDAAQLSAFFLAVLGGMSARARDGGSPADLEGIAALALAALGER